MFYEVENMIAGVVGYDSTRKHFANCVVNTREISRKYHPYMDVYIENKRICPMRAGGLIL